MIRNILLSFIPIFVAVDAIGVLPILSSLTQGLDAKQKNRIIVQSMLIRKGLTSFMAPS